MKRPVTPPLDRLFLPGGPDDPLELLSPVASTRSLSMLKTCKEVLGACWIEGDTRKIKVGRFIRVLNVLCFIIRGPCWEISDSI